MKNNPATPGSWGSIGLALGAVISTLLVSTAVAEQCYGHITYRPYQGFHDGEDIIAVVCGTDCSLASYECQSNLQFTPDPPSHEKVCNTGFEETGYRCVPNTVYPTVTFYQGRGYCNWNSGQTGCDSGCADWDTQLSTSDDTRHWQEDTVAECADA